MKTFYKVLPVVLIFAFFLTACGKGKDDVTTTAEPVTVADTSTVVDEALQTGNGTIHSTAAVNTPAEATTSGSSLPFTIPEKSFDTYFTTDPENKFISAVIASYNIDPSLLACIYASNESDSNYVWQFNGTTDANGKVLKNADTLKYVYALSADCTKIQRTNGGVDNIGCTFAEGYIVFRSTKELLIPEYLEQLNA